MDVRTALVLFATLLLAQGSFAAICPLSCVCSTTSDGLHKATCSNVYDLARFLLQKRHHNINILDLSHNNITKLTYELENMNELVALDLSTNGFVTVDSFLNNSTKLVHLNLANNRIRALSFSKLPRKLSSLDLSNNLLKDVPSDLKSLPYLEHLQLEGNPIECSCKNLLLRDYLLLNGISVDNVRCSGPNKYYAYSWLEIKTKEICEDSTAASKVKSKNYIGFNANQISDDSTMLKFKPSQILSDLDEGMTWVADSRGKDYENEDEVVFFRAKRQNQANLIEGSGNNEVTDDYQTTSSSLNEPLIEDKGLEGSGEGSGYGLDTLRNLDNDYDEEKITETTQTYALYTNPIAPFFDTNEVENSPIPDEITYKPPSIYEGKEWYNHTTGSYFTSSPPTTTIEVPAGAEKIKIDKSETEQSEITSETKSEEKPAVQRSGTYICIAIIIILLVGLIGFAVIKGQFRKRRDRRLQRQQKRDIEKASREMVDMNTSLLGKPAPTNGTENKINGKYELVPTHDSSTKKSENGIVTSSDNPTNSKRDNNQNREEQPRSLANVDTAVPAGKPVPSSLDSKKENGSLSSEEIFVPENEDSPHSNGVASSDVTQPLTNGDHTDSNYLSPSKYVPVYSLDTGRVRIKMTETPKPKTPVLVNRSRSNAGDIVVTPSLGPLPQSKT